MAKKKKDIYRPISPDNMKELVPLCRAYGVHIRKVNYYHIKLKHEEDETVYDWYHTTGTLVSCKGKYFKNVGRYHDPEDICIMIEKKVYGR